MLDCAVSPVPYGGSVEGVLLPETCSLDAAIALYQALAIMSTPWLQLLNQGASQADKAFLRVLHHLFQNRPHLAKAAWIRRLMGGVWTPFNTDWGSFWSLLEVDPSYLMHRVEWRGTCAICNLERVWCRPSVHAE
jgi:hypothetical protein